MLGLGALIQNSEIRPPSTVYVCIDVCQCSQVLINSKCHQYITLFAFYFLRIKNKTNLEYQLVKKLLKRCYRIAMIIFLRVYHGCCYTCNKLFSIRNGWTFRAKIIALTSLTLALCFYSEKMAQTMEDELTSPYFQFNFIV